MSDDIPYQETSEFYFLEGRSDFITSIFAGKTIKCVWKFLFLFLSLLLDMAYLGLYYFF